MSEYKRTVYLMECDYNGYWAPSTILRQTLDYILLDNKRDGCDQRVLQEKLGAVWMISRMRIYQYSQIGEGDELVFHTFPRVIENGHYIMYVEIYRGEELVVRFDSVFIAVYAHERKIVPVDVMEPLWLVPPREAESKYLLRMNMDCDYRPGGVQTVRRSDCDSNRQLTSPGYLSLVCDVLGFWNEDKPLMRFMQVDYASEILPGTQVHFEVGERDGAKLLRAYKGDGKLSFSAMCEF